MRRSLLVLAAAMTAACGAPASSGPPAPSSAAAVEEVPGIAAEAVRLRTDEAVGGRVQVRITNTGDDAFTVTSVALDSPGFTALPATALTAEFPPGRVIDLPTPYGEPDCGAAPLPAVARLVVQRAGGDAGPLEVPLAADVLQVVHDEECAVRGVAEVVDVAVSGLADDGDTLAGSLTLTRRNGNQDVVVTAVDRSVLVDVRAEALPLELAEGERSASTGIAFTPASCDPHVLSETKKPYVFPVTVQVGEGDPVPVDLPLDQGTRDLLAALVQRVCTGTG